MVAITCISHPSSQATAKAQAADPAAELQLEGVTGEDEGLEGGLEGDLEGNASAEGPALDLGRAPGHVGTKAATIHVAVTVAAVFIVCHVLSVLYQEPATPEE